MRHQPGPDASIPFVRNRTDFGVPSTRRAAYPPVRVKRTGKHSACAPGWAELQDHFRHHASLLRRFERADAKAVARMWKTNRNEVYEPLSAFELEALIERHCELFGTWPT
jgi:hypothetical protein